MTYLTEDEARQKWCPHVRGVVLHDGELTLTGNTALKSSNSAVRFKNPDCIASDCMSWRWSPKRTNDGRTLDQTKGYCGLAGRPE